MEKMLEKNKKQEKKPQKNKRLRSRYLLWKTKVIKFDNKKKYMEYAGDIYQGLLSMSEYNY